jgi:8-oxo-dGTP pyrophosphatase MutT (NUDIX family)
LAAFLRDGKILLVREAQRKGPDNGKWNHPAGWIDVGENPIEAVKREVLEESGFTFTPKYLLGIYSLVRKDIEKELGATPHAYQGYFYRRYFGKTKWKTGRRRNRSEMVFS